MNVKRMENLSWPTDYDFAVLSYQAYFSAEEQRNPTYWGENNLPPLQHWKNQGWTLHASAENIGGGYYGYAWVNHRYKHLVFAHRGTASLAAVKADAEGIVLGELTPQQAAAAAFVAKTLGATLPLPHQPSYDVKGIGRLSTEFSDYHLAFTGHSLGAWLAELCTATFHRLHAYAVTFDSPGAGPMLEKLNETNIQDSPDFRLSQLNITTYLTAPNLINTCHPHVGQVRRLYPKSSEESVSFFGWKKAEEQLVQIKQWFTHTITQHSMTGILETFVDGYPREQKQVVRWPRFQWETLAKTQGSVMLPWGAVFTAAKALYYLRASLQQYRCFHQYVMDNDTIEPDLESLSLENQYRLLYQGHYQATSELHRLRISHQHPAIKGLWLLGGGIPTLVEGLKVLLARGVSENLHLESPMDTQWVLKETGDIRRFLRQLSSELMQHATVQQQLRDASIAQTKQGGRLLGLEQQFRAFDARVDDLENRVYQIEQIPLTPNQRIAWEAEIANQLQQFKIKLNQSHKDHATIETVFGDKLPLTQSTFVNLSMLEEQVQKLHEASKLNESNAPTDDKNQQNKGRKANDLHEQHLTSFESIYAVKTPVPLKDLWQTKTHTDGQPTNPNAPAARYLLALGRAGVGKSTCCKYVALMHDVLWPGKFDFVFLIPWRALTASFGFQAGMSLSEVLYHNQAKHQAVTPVRWDALFEKINKQPDKVLLLLDGYDEITPQQLNITTSLEAAPLVKGLIEAPFYKLITSRPYGVENLRPEARLEIIGFTDDNIDTYVKQYFNEAHQQVACLTFLKSNPSIWGTAHIPIIIELLCRIWKDNLVQLNEDLTLTHLYYKIVTALLRRYLANRQREGLLPNTTNSVNNLLATRVWELSKDMLDFLAELAEQGLSEGNLIIGSATIQYCQANKSDSILREALTSGFLKNQQSDKTEIHQSIYFIHLTFQEFLIAYSLVNKLRASEKSEYQQAQQRLKALQYQPRYQIVVWFCAGLWTLPAEQRPWPAHPNSDRFWETLLQEPRDLSLVYEASLTARCVEEAGLQKLTTNNNNNQKFYSRCIQMVCVLVEGFANKAKTLPNQLMQNLTLCPKFMTSHIIPIHLKIYKANSDSRWGVDDETRVDIQRTILKTWSAIGTGLLECTQQCLPLLLPSPANWGQKSIRDLAIPSLAALAPMLNDDQKTEVLKGLEHAESAEDVYIRAVAIETYGKLFPNFGVKQRDTAFKVLIKVTEGDKISWTCEVAAKTLGELTAHFNENERTTAFNALKKLSKEYEHVRLAIAAIEALGEIIPKLDGVEQIKIFQEVLQPAKEKDKHKITYYATTRILEALAPTLDAIQRNTALESLLQVIQNEKEKYILKIIPKALEKLIPKLEENQKAEVFKALLQLTKIDEVEENAVQVLQQHIPSFSASHCAQAFWDLYAMQLATRYPKNNTTNAVGKLSTTLEESEKIKAFSTLKKDTKDESSNTREIAVAILVSTASTLDDAQRIEIFKILHELSSKDDYGFVRRAAAKGLGQLILKLQNEQKAEAFKGLLQRTTQDKKEYVRTSAVMTIEQLAHTLDGTQRIDAIAQLQLASEDKEKDVNEAAAEALIAFSAQELICEHLKRKQFNESCLRALVAKVWKDQSSVIIINGQLQLYQAKTKQPFSHSTPNGMAEFLLQGRVPALKQAFQNEI